MNYKNILRLNVDFKISPPLDSNEGYISKCVIRRIKIFGLGWDFAVLAVRMVKVVEVI